jgi:hypothetical protein
VEAADLGEVVHGTHPNPPRPGERPAAGAVLPVDQNSMRMWTWIKR